VRGLFFEGFFVVAIKELLNIAHLVVDFTANLGKGNYCFISPALPSPAANFH